MKISKIFASICAALLSSLLSFQAIAQTDSTRVRGIQYTSEIAARLYQKEKPKGIEGLALSVDLLGAVLANVSSYGQYEAALRLNIGQIIFPIAEAGWGVCNKEDEGTQMHFKSRAPYVRLGCDYNFLSDLSSGNRLFGGMRVGFSNFKYDLKGPDMQDPYWGQSVAYDFKGVSSNALWAELVFGLEAAVTKRVHLGWSLRYKRRIRQKMPIPGQAWYVPGFGKNDISAFGGTFNVVLEL